MIKHIKNVGIGIGSILALIQLFQIVRDYYSENLIAKVYYGDLVAPPIIGKIFSDKYVILDRVEAESLFVKIRNNKTYRIYDFERKIDYMDQKKYLNPFYDPLMNALTYRAYWSVEIINEGVKTLTNVSMKIPNTKLFEVTKDEKTEEFYNHLGLVKLGNMQPKEKISIYAWKNFPDVNPSSNDFYLTHDLGVGSISILKPTGKLGYWIEHNLFIIFLFYYYVLL